MKQFFKVLISWIVIFTVIIGGGIYILSDVLIPEKESTGASENNTKKSNEDIEVLVMGVDSADSKKRSNERTDTLIAVRYSEKTGIIKGISIPRDTKVDIKGHGKEKINHAYAYGGPELTLKSVNKLLDTKIENYVVVDYTIVEEVVDTIGGVKLDVPMDMYYSDPYSKPPLYINLKKGVQKLDGDEALQFLRFRKGYTDQDLGRIQAQQQFIQKTIETMLDAKNIIKVPKLIKSGFKNVDTNISLKKILGYSFEMKNIDTEKMQIETLPGVPEIIDEVAYVVNDEKKTKKLVKEVYYSNELVEWKEEADKPEEEDSSKEDGQEESTQ